MAHEKIISVALLALVFVSLGCVNNQGNGTGSEQNAGLNAAEPTLEEQEIANDLQELDDLQSDLAEVEDLGNFELDTSVFE